MTHLPLDTPLPQQLSWSGRTDRGKVRMNNEDSFLALQFNAQEVNYLGKVGEASTDNTDFVFAVSDGMGGAMAGEFASRITVEKITRLLPQSFKHSRPDTPRCSPSSSTKSTRRSPLSAPATRKRVACNPP